MFFIQALLHLLLITKNCKKFNEAFPGLKIIYDFYNEIVLEEEELKKQEEEETKMKMSKPKYFGDKS